MKIKNNNCNSKATGVLLIRNSWGTGWGDNGYGWLPYQYVLKGLVIRSTSCMPSRMTKHYALYMKIFTYPSVLLFASLSSLSNPVFSKQIEADLPGPDHSALQRFLPQLHQRALKGHFPSSWPLSLQFPRPGGQYLPA